WLTATAVRSASALPVVQAPYHAWLALWHARAAGSYLTSTVLTAPAAVPLGLLAGGLAWSLRLRSMATLAGGRSPGAAIAFDRRQWRHQVRSAAARIAAPGSVPLLTARGQVAVGAVIRTVGHRAGQLALIPADRLRSHQIVVG